MNWLDYLIIVVFLALSFIIGYFSSRRDNTLKAHFQSEGKLSWFVSGTAMVATTFAADTPLAVTEIVYQYGIWGNWIWWYMAIGSLFTVFLFAPLWKRAKVTTDLELVNLRYAKKGSQLLRIGKAIYLGLFMNIIIMAWVNLAMKKILEVFFPNTSTLILISLLFFFALLYTATSGLTGISYVDTFQFFFAMSGCVVLSVVAVQNKEIGGLSGIIEKITPEKISFFPNFVDSASPFHYKKFLLFITIAWWASWYPGAEPGGGGYIAQRILATRDEKSATLASLWFTFAHYFLRPWPWILVALASLILYPNLAPNESGKGFVYVMRDLLPNGLLGLLLASFLAAYLSTIATHLNWGASYLVYDFYKPYIKSYEKDSHYLLVTKLIELLFMVSSIWITFYALESISGTWSFLIEASAGVGFALVARWFLPIISAWGELVGFIVPLIFHFLGKNFQLWDVNLSLLYNTIFTVIVVLVVSYFTKEDFETLRNFYFTVRPPGVFWKNWAKQNNLEVQESELSIFNAFLKVVVVLLILYLGLFSIGKLLLG